MSIMQRIHDIWRSIVHAAPPPPDVQAAAIKKFHDQAIKVAEQSEEIRRVIADDDPLADFTEDIRRHRRRGAPPC